MRRQCSPYVFLLSSPPDFNSFYLLTEKQALAQCDRTALKITAIVEWDKHSVRKEFFVLTPPRRRWLQAVCLLKSQSLNLTVSMVPLKCETLS